MFEYLEKIQKKPLYYRKRVLVVATVSLTSIIALVWFITVDFNLDPVDPKALADDLRPVSEIKSSIGSFFDSAKNIGVKAFGSFSDMQAKSPDAAILSTSTKN